MHNSLTQENFITRSLTKHGQKYDYNDSVFINTKIKVKIHCLRHGVFEQTPESHMYGQGCPRCGKESSASKQPLSLDHFITRSSKVHGSKYDYSSAVYVNSGIKVKIICPIHGEFEKTPDNHYKGQGCPECGRVIQRNSKLKTHNEFIEDAKLAHGEKYDYSETRYVDSYTKVMIRCIDHDLIFKQSPTTHIDGQTGCKKCQRFESSGEKSVSSYLDSHNFEYVREKTFKTCKLTKNGAMKFDFYLPELNLLIEYDGEQHFLPVKFWSGDGEKNLESCKVRDKFKTEWAQSNGYKLLRICYKDLKRVDQVLDEYLGSLLPHVS